MDYFRNFFLWVKSKEFLVFLFFFLVSGAYWALLALKDTVEKEIELKVNIVNKPKNVIITDEGYDTLRVSLRDNVYAIIPYYFKDIETVNINFANYSNNEDGRLTVSGSELMKLVKAKLDKQKEVVAVKPDKLDVYYSYGDSKMVPVVFFGETQPADKYFLTKRSIEPDSVRIFATKERLAAIDSVRTRYVRITDISEKVTRTVMLQKEKGVGCEPSSVTVHAYADVHKDATREVPIVAVNMPEGVVIRTFPSKVAVSFVTTANLDRDIHSADFRVEVDYHEVEEGTGQKSLPLHLVKVPSTIKRPKLAFLKVDYLIEHQ